MDDAKNLDRKEFRTLYGSCDDKIPVPGKVKSEVKKIISDLEQEENLPNNLTFGQALMIMKERAQSLKDFQDDEMLRGTISGKK